MTKSQLIFAAATLFAAIGTWLMLPRGTARGRRLGMLLGAASLGLFAATSSRLGNWVGEGVFWGLGGLTVVAAAGTISARSPVYSAIWFALVLLGTAGMFLEQGAQFLGVATVVVYAGAILVMFLFVLMLAQSEGHTHYDRLSWEALLSSATGAVMIGMLMMVINGAMRAPLAAGRPDGAPAAESLGQAAARSREILATDHVAHLGRELFSRHLIAVEVAGTLLLAALVGAVAIVAQGKRSPALGDVVIPERGARLGEGVHGS